ncbi:hypothetical protein ACEZCY_14535 [Streptacidiphilus sp. N1-12]|uniref:Uncharacterized protein n=2 Tax=Streptacidiphilus alkalitolerans TaxID=3342712 RepID=A0ABV6VA30_9ACTN
MTKPSPKALRELIENTPSAWTLWRKPAPAAPPIPPPPRAVAPVYEACGSTEALADGTPVSCRKPGGHLSPWHAQGDDRWRTIYANRRAAADRPRTPAGDELGQRRNQVQILRAALQQINRNGSGRTCECADTARDALARADAHPLASGGGHG